MKISASRETMLAELGLEGKDCAEIGVYTGYFSGEILKQNPKSLLMVDPWKHQDNKTYPHDYGNREDPEFENIYREVHNKVKDDKRVRIIRDYSFFVAPQIPNHSFDFIYIDAVHTFESCYCDICIWYHKVKPGGWLCGHDFTGWVGQDAIYPGVRQAVEAFCRISRCEISLLTTESHSSWGIQVPLTRAIPILPVTQPTQHQPLQAGILQPQLQQ